MKFEGFSSREWFRKVRCIGFFHSITALIFLISGVGAQHESEARRYFLKSKTAAMTSQFDSAHVYLDKSLALYQQSADMGGLMDCTLQRAVIFLREGEHYKVLPLLDSLLATPSSSEPKYLTKTAGAYNILGGSQADLGDRPRALASFSKALQLGRELFPPGHPVTTGTLVNVGTVKSGLNDFSGALEDLQEARRIFENFGKPETDRSLAVVLSNIGFTHAAIGNHALAVEHYQESLRIKRNAVNPEPRAIAITESNLASAYFDFGDFSRALAHAQSSEELWREISGGDHPKLAKVLSLKGKAHGGLGQFEKAFESSDEAIRIGRNVFEKSHPDLAQVLADRASILSMAGETGPALTNHQEAIAVIEKGESEYYPQKAKYLEAMGDIYAGRGEWESALGQFQAAVATLSSSVNGDDFRQNPAGDEEELSVLILSSLRKKGEMLFLIGAEKRDLELVQLSLETFERAGELALTSIGRYASDESKLNLVRKNRGLFRRGVEAAHWLYSRTAEKSHLEHAFHLAGSGKSAVLSDNLMKTEVLTLGSFPDSLVEEEGRLRTAVNFYENRYLLKALGDPEEREDKTKESASDLFQARRAYRELQEHLRASSPRYEAVWSDADPIGSEQIRSHLPRRTSLLEYSISDTAISIFVLDHRGLSLISVPIGESFPEIVREYMRSIRTVDPPLFRKASRQLYDLLISPIEGKIRGKRHLVIVPDGILQSIPFEAFLTRESSTNDFSRMSYLISNFSVSYHHSARLLSGSQSGDGLNSFVGIAPGFRDQASAPDITALFPSVGIDALYVRSGLVLRGGMAVPAPLPASAEEVSEVSSLFRERGGRAHTVLGRAATEGAVKSELPSGNILHFSTHGFANEQEPNLSALLLSAPEDTSEQSDGILFVSEIYDLDIDADLVVLSGCDAGVGALAEGEGLLSLERAFRIAGASNVIASLWKVNDSLTRDFMVAFYSNLLKRGNYGDSLRRAKLEMIKSARHSAPRTWAPFVFFGKG